MRPDSVLTVATEPPPGHDYWVAEAVDVLMFRREGFPLYVAACEQLWLIEDPESSDELRSQQADTVEVIRAITAVDDHPAPSLWSPGTYWPFRNPDVLWLLGGQEPGQPPRGFRCACGRLKHTLYRWPWGGFTCHRCRKARRRQGSTTSAGPLVLEEEGQRFVLAAQPTRYAPGLLPFDLIVKCWRGQN